MGNGASSTLYQANSACTATLAAWQNTFFGRADLRKGASGAKFHPGADFEVKRSVAPPKSAENVEKLKINTEKNSGNNNITITERGTCFGYRDLMVDPRSFLFLKKSIGCF